MYSCQRCGYNSNLKANLKKHLQKKNVCQNILCSKTPQQLLLELYPSEKKVTPTHVCTCGNKYTHLSALYRHRNSCEKYLHAKEFEILKDKVQQLEKQISSRTVNNNCTTNVNSNNTVNNTVIVNNFGYENISYLTPEFIEKCTCFLSIGLKNMVKAIHLNKHHPENHNIKVTNMKSSYIPVLMNHKWIMKDKKEALRSLIEKTSDILRCYFEDKRDQIKEKYNCYKRDAIEFYHERLEKEDKELWNKLMKDIFLLFVNEKDLFQKKKR